MEEELQDEDIEHVFVEFSDVNGISRSKQLQTDYFLENWRDRFAMNAILLFQTPRNDVPEETGLGKEIDYGDATAHPIPGTFQRLPWKPETARVLCSFELEGEPLQANPRQVLKRVIDEQVAEYGFEFTVGSELDFYLLDPDEDAPYAPATNHNYENVTWATESASPFYDRVTDWTDDYGIDLKSIEHEHGAGQLEVLFDYGTVFDQADTSFDFKRLIKRAAREEGKLATSWLSRLITVRGAATTSTSVHSMATTTYSSRREASPSSGITSLAAFSST